VLGQKVKFDMKYVRVTNYISSRRYQKTWKELHVEPTIGIIVGARSIRNGTYINYRDEDSGEFKTKESLPCYLVSYHLRREIIKVPIDNVIFVVED
jgi:hypothetical protein